MAFVLNFAKTVRTHWKKSILFCGVAVYGANFAKEKYEDELLRREYCVEAKLYGDQKVDLGTKCRKITVFLNPAASGGKGRKIFEKNAAPLLYLAGIEVNIVKTEYDGQVKEFMKVLEKEHLNGIVVAGGNATLLETVTGFMRKDDKTFRQTIPIGVIPIGESNMFASCYYGTGDKSDVRMVLDAAMAVVRGSTQKMDVIKIQGEDGRSTYALCGLETGGYRDARERTHKFWYYGPLKQRVTYVWHTVWRWPAVLRGSMEYVLSSDANRVKMVKPQVVVEDKPQPSKSWFGFLFGSRNVKKKTGDLEEAEEFFNEEDYTHKAIETVELNLTANVTNTLKMMRGVEVEIGPAELTKGDFITEGWRRLQEPTWKTGCDDNEKLEVSRLKFTPELKEGSTPLWYSIDGEQYEAMPIEVTLLKKRLNIFSLPKHQLQNG